MIEEGNEKASLGMLFVLILFIGNPQLDRVD